MKQKDSDRERSAGLPGNPEINEVSGVGCPPLKNLSRHQHRYVRVLRIHYHTRQCFPTESLSFTALSFHHLYFFPVILLAVLFFHTHSNFPIRFLFPSRVGGRWPLVFSAGGVLRSWAGGRVQDCVTLAEVKIKNPWVLLRMLRNIKGRYFWEG